MKELNVNEKLNLIENELVSLKSMIIGVVQKKSKKLVALKGLLKGIKISEEDIKESKKSLFKDLN